MTTTANLAANLTDATVSEVTRLAGSWARAYAAAGYNHMYNRGDEVAMDKGPTVTGKHGGTFCAWTPSTAEGRLFVRIYKREFAKALA